MSAPASSRLGSLCIALLAAACSTTPEAPVDGGTPSAIPLDGGARLPAQTLGANDVFEVRVIGEPDLSGAWRVSSEGAFVFPFCGRVEASNRTPTALAEALTTCLGAGYLKNPQVAVFLRESNSKKVFVLGEVNKPGTFVYEDGMSVVQAVTLAGGFTKLAARNSVLVTRSLDGQEHRLKLSVDDIGTGRRENFTLQPGDIVFVPESFF